jgi:hypothetical protein
MDHGQKATGEISQIIGQIRIDAGNQGLLTEAGVEAEDHFSHKKITKGIKPINLEKIQGLNYCASALGHLLFFHIPITVYIEMLVQRDASGLQHGRPVDAVGFEDVLGDQVLDYRPELSKERTVGIGQGGGVVDKSIKPDVGYITVIKRQSDPPT